MSITRKYNDDSGQWEVISTSSASTVSVRSEKLLPESKKETNVEEVLQRFSDDITTLKGNVSWLAEHGGGGSGTGGGGMISGEIKVNGYATGSDVVLGSDGLAITIQSSMSTARWQIQATTGNSILKSANNVNSVKISSDDIKKAGLDKTFRLSITAFNEESLTNIYWDGTIQIASVEVNTKSEVSYNFVDIDKPASQVIYTCTVGVLGLYFLYINGKRFGDAIMFSEKTKEIVVQLGDLINDPYNIELNVGSNTLTAYMASASDEQVKSVDCVSTVLLIANTPVISCSAFSTNEAVKTPVYINIGKKTVVQVPYTVYYKNGVFKAQILTKYDTKESWDSIPTFNSYNRYYENASCTLPETVIIDEDIEITIYIYDGVTQKEYSQTYYGITMQPDYGLLTEPDSVFTFRTFYGAIYNKQWKEKNATLSIINQNVKSKEIQVGQNKSLRLQNASYAIITNNGKQSFYYDYITDQIKEFSLSICYKADFHPDDDRTVLAFALTATENYTPNQGILIRDHKLYIGQNTFDLQDQELMTITITYKSVDQDTNSGNVFLYVNGVVESVFSDMPVTSLIPVNQKEIYIGAQVEDGKELFYTDMNLYRVSMYNKCLNPLDVLYEYLNDQACANLKDGDPNTEYIQEGLLRNFITVDDSGKYQSNLYDPSQTFDNNAYLFTDYFSVNKLVENSPSFKVISTISNLVVPIPIMTIDVSNSAQWTWNNFIQANNNLEKTNCDFSYYDQNGSNTSIVSGRCYVNIQGTSTLSDVIKNLQIEFDDDVIFTPKDTWFPEQQYTLKADIVDSSHSLNASIGKFVNQEFGLTYNSTGSISNSDSWYPFAETVKNTFVSAKTNKNSDMNKYFPKGTLKHGVEGFPVFLIMKFKSDDSSSLSIHSLGIYQFILGRQSPRNLGYEIVNSVTFSGTEPKQAYPMYAESVSIQSIQNKGYWLEANMNDSFPDSMSFQEQEDLKDQKMTGLFWQEDLDGVYYDSVIDIKYNNLGDEKVSSVTKFKPFTDFVKNIISLPVTNRRYSITGNSMLARHTISNSQYPKYKSQNTTSTGITWTKINNENNVICGPDDNLEAALKELNLTSYAKYFVIAMMFGLIDNFEKNMPIKFYKHKNSNGKEDGTWENPILGIYDTDTGLGGDNEALLTVSETAWISTIQNKNGALCETSGHIDGKKTTIIGQNNKLWFFDSEDVNYKLFNSKEGSFFVAFWNSMLRRIGENHNIANITLKDLVDIYYNDYFLQQTNGCGELLFNMTYFAKYLNTYISGNGTPQNQSSKLHGRRQQQVRKWLNGRVVFLDSLYQALGTNTSIDPNGAYAITPNSGSITSGSVPSLKITANNPIITKISHQTESNCQYLLLDKNETGTTFWGNSEPASQSFNHVISQSDSIQAIGDDDQHLSDIYYVKINNGTFPYLTEYNASNCDRLGEESKNGVSYFKPDSGISQLRTIDLSNTAKAANSSINYVLNLSTGYEKLQKLNLYNSCVTNLTLPEGDNSIPLLYFDIRGCQLTSLRLADQNLLTSIDLSNCTRLSNFEMTSCDNITSINFNSSQQSLRTVDIASDTFKSFSCVSNNSVRSINIQSSALETVTITNCTQLTDVVIACSNIKTINLSGCTKLSSLTLVSNQDSIGTLNLYQTALKTIKKNADEEDGDIMDLSRFTSISDFNIQNNTAVEYIQFTNNKTKPIAITRGFACSNLKRVYGNMRFDTSGIFNNCYKFSIHGEDMLYNGQGVQDDTGRVKHFVEMPELCENSEPKFQDGLRVTNITFNNTDQNSCFASTSCTIFDVYYALYKCKSQTNISSMFSSCSKVQFQMTDTCDNSPSRYMFTNCGNVTNISSLFYNCSMKNVRLISPDNDGTNVTKDNGLFSPLKSCVYQNYAFNGLSSAIGDRFMFRTTGGWAYKLNNFEFFPVRYIVDDVRKVTKPIDEAWIKSNFETMGNLNGFFDQLPNCQYLYSFLSTLIINYELSGDIKSYGISYRNSFISECAIGEIELDKLFRRPANITEISGSFRSTGGSWANIIHNDFGVSKASLTIKEGMLDNFTNLQILGYNPNAGNSASSADTASFYGADIEKSFGDSTFPYNIFAYNKSLIRLGCFFRDVKMGALQETDIKLPGNMFKNNTNLVYIQHMFRNVPFKFSLTSEGFANCSKLQYVDYMFYGAGQNITGGIPKRFLYHGGSTVSKTYTGAYLLEKDGSTLKYDPMEYDENGAQIGIKDEDKQTITITYFQPNQNLISATYMFYGCNLDSYINEDPEIENNPSYMPFTHIVSGGSVQKTTYNPIEKTCMWEYDGVTLPSGYTGENLDEEYSAIRAGVVQYFTNYSTPCDMHYAFPPDLFRYFQNSSNTTLTAMFQNCGYTGDNSGGNYATPNISDVKNYGLKGRLVPYMFKNISNLSSMYGMFQNCNLLSAYTTESDVSYVIPQTLFKYAQNVTDLSYAFSGMTYPNNINLDVFSPLKKSINVAYIFYLSRFNGTSTKWINIRGIFKNKQITDLRRAFSCNTSDGNYNDQAPRHKTSYIIFDGIFSSDKVAKNKDYYVFDGYYQNYVQFLNKSLSQDNASDPRNNYRVIPQ